MNDLCDKCGWAKSQCVCNQEVVVSKKENTTSRMTAQQAIELLRKHNPFGTEKLLYTHEAIEIADLIERLQACQSCEKQSNQFFGKCEGCEVMKDGN